MLFSETISRDEKRKKLEDDEKEKDYYKRMKRYEEVKEKSPDQSVSYIFYKCCVFNNFVYLFKHKCFRIFFWNNEYNLFECLVGIRLVTEIEVAADVRKNPTQAAIVPQKIIKKTIVVKDPNININPKNLKNIHAVIIQVIIQTHQTTAPIRTIVVIHENVYFL